MSHNANTYHCSRYPGDRVRKHVALCGCVERDLGSFNPDAFWNGPKGKFWTQCPECLVHPDLPLVLLGDL